MFLSKHSNGTYYLYYPDEQGKRQEVSTHCNTKPMHSGFCKRSKVMNMNAQIKQGINYFPSSKKDFLAYAEGNLSKGTVDIYEAALHNFINQAGDLPLASYTPQHFDIIKTEDRRLLSRLRSILNSGR